MTESLEVLYWQRKIFEHTTPLKFEKAKNLLLKYKPDNGIALMIGTAQNGCVRLIFDNNASDHLLIAGDFAATSTILIKSFILSIIYQYNPEQCRVLLFDSANKDKTIWSNFAHLFQPVLSDVTETLIELQKIKQEISSRMQTPQKYPKLVIILDKYQDLILADKQQFEDIVKYITMHGASVGVHLILATTKLDLSVISGTIKACFSQRIVSRTETGAGSKLLINNDAATALRNANCILYQSGAVQEIMPPAIDEHDMQLGIEYSNKSFATPEHDTQIDAYDEIKKFAIAHNGIRLSKIQLLGNLGYGHAQSVLGQLISDGILLSTPDETGKYPLKG